MVFLAISANQTNPPPKRNFISSKDKQYYKNTNWRITEMAKPIELSLTLEGQDAIDFDEYCKNPVVTELGLETAGKALDYLREHGNEL